MDRSSAVRAINPNAAPASREDAELWGRVISHLNAEAPLPAVLARPWRWLNQRQTKSSASATSRMLVTRAALRKERDSASASVHTPVWPPR